jgi:hypothetical protein
LKKEIEKLKEKEEIEEKLKWKWFVRPVM